MKSAKVFLPFFLVLGFLSLSQEAAGQSLQFRRGDANGDGSLDLSDAVKTIASLFLDGGDFDCAKAADADDDGIVNITDILYSLNFLFLSGKEPPAPGLRCGGDPTTDLLDCKSYGACPEIPREGQSDFTTPLTGNPNTRSGTEATDAAGPGANGNPSATQPPAADTKSTTPERLIEESDIYKLEGDLLFVLNRYRGLQVIDLADLDRPKMIGRAPIYGYPKEMYVRGDRVYVIVSDYFTFWRDVLTAGDSIPIVNGFYGSQLRILDISDPRSPQVIGGIDLNGDCTDSRIVGEVCYLVSQRYTWYYNNGSDDVVDQTEVVSVSIADPGNVRLVDRKAFPRNGWNHHISVTPEAIYLASSGYEGGDWNNYRTRIQYIEISDPLGAISIRGSAAVPGMVQDRWSMDEYQGVLRVASSQGWWNGDVYLTTLGVENPDQIVLLGRYTLHVNENLTAARFDGPRGYLVTYRAIDPLFSFDLSDPERPELLGELKMTGWLDFMVPMGDRIVALGHEDVTVDQVRKVSLAVSLIDSSEGAVPKLLSRVTLDGAWGWVPSTRDDFAKVFRTLPAQSLILFPFQAWSATDYNYIGGVQLIDLFRDKLVKRGLIGNTGWWVERGIPDGESTVLTLSSEIFQVVDIADRDSPRLRGKLELARNVTDFALLPGEDAVELSSDWYRGDTQLTVTPAADPDTPSPLAQVALPVPYGRLFVNGAMAYVATTRQIPGDPNYQQETRVQVFDLTDPENPKERGSVKLPEDVSIGGGWFWGWGDEVIQVNGSVLAFHRSLYFWWYRGALDAAGATPPGTTDEPTQKIFLVDLADPDSPRLASTVVLKDIDWAWGLKASGSFLYLSSYRAEVLKEQWVARYFLNRIDVADPANPIRLPEVNIPGMFVDASPSGSSIYTSETYWESDWSKSHNFLHALEIVDDKAYLLSSVELPGYSNGIQVKDGAAFAVTYWWDSIVTDVTTQWVGHTDLVTIDLADPKAIRIAGQAKVPFDYAYLQKVDGGRAFIGSWAGIFVYQVGDIANPAFEDFFRTQGWSQDIVVRGDTAYVPSGYYGVQVLKLGTGKTE